MAFADLVAKLRLDISNFSSQMTEASKLMRRFSNKMNQQYGDAAASLTKHNMGLKDTARIVQGILVAQAFYGGARAIREATSALWGFNEALDYAHVTYSALFGSEQLATDFMGVLKEHSIQTIFDYEQLATASKKLLAYGIDYKNLMFIMEGLTNLGAMSGDAAALDRISLALGQIYTRGKLTAEEMRQLANAYVPIAEIVQEKFNLTPDQMGKIGDLNLPAHEVINAVVDYANERFGSVGDAAMFTITGLKNKIVDTLKVLGVDMIAPVTRAFKSFLAYVDRGLAGVRNAYTEGGLGGVLEHLVPDENTQAVVRQFLATVRNMFMSIVSFGKVAGQIMGNFGRVLITAFNVVQPVITLFTNAILKSLNAILNTRAGATILQIALLGAAASFVVLKAKAIGALVITTVTKAVMGLSKALLILSTIITKHPILALLSLLAVSLVGVSLASNNANRSIGGLFDTLNAAGGKSGSDMLPNINKELEDMEGKADQFNDRLEGSADAAEDLADGIGQAGKEAKKTGDLLSFDEVFRLKDDAASGAGSGIGSIEDALGNLTEGFSGLGDALIPDIPDFSEYISDFTDGLFGGLKDTILGKIAIAGIGALIAQRVLDGLAAIKVTASNAAVVKFAKIIGAAIMGAFIGLGIDALLSPFTDKFWEYMEKHLEISGDAKKASISATIASIIGGAIGMLIGGKWGGILGAVLGQFIGGLVGFSWDDAKTAVTNGVAGFASGAASAIAKAWGGSFTDAVKLLDFTSFKSFFGSIGALFSGAGLKAVAKGGVIGLAIGLVTDAIAGMLWGTLQEKLKLSEGSTDRAATGQTIGSILATLIGGLLGGPPGAMIGAAIGTFAGGYVGLFWEQITSFFSRSSVMYGTSYGTAIGAAIGAFFGPIGMAVGGMIGTLAGALVGHFWEPIKGWFVQAGKDIGEFFTNLWNAISGWFVQAGKDIGEFFTNLWNTIADWFSDACDAIAAWFSDVWAGISTWFNTAWEGISAWFSKVWVGISTWFSTAWEDISAWFSKVWEGISAWFSDLWDYISTWFSKVWSSISNWFNNAWNDISAWFSKVWNGISTWFANIWNDISAWFSKVWNGISTWFANIRNDLTGWLSKIWGSITSWLSNLWGSISKWFSDLGADIKDWWKGLWDSSKWTSAWTHVKDWFSDLWDSISGWFTDIGKSVKTWWSDLWNLKSPNLNSPTLKSPTLAPAPSFGAASLIGRANGGIFNREHIARFAEGNKAEAIIPLENNRAMQPFVDAVSDGLVGSLAPLVANGSGNASNQLPPMYVGTLIADENGLKQLYKKFEIIKVQEDARRGTALAY